MNKAETKNQPILGLFFPVLIGLLLTFGMLFLCAVLIFTEKIPEAAASYLPFGALLIGGAPASFIAARKAESSKLLHALYAAGMLFLCLFLLSLCFVQMPINLTHMAMVGLTLLLSAGFGGMAATGMKHSRGKQKRKRK